jgi:heme-degrading monooxygenase HmoA
MPEPVLTIFRSRLRPEAHAEYEPVAARMDELAATMPGFLGIKTFQAADGERVSIVEFASAAEALAWRNHPEHREAQRLGRERFYAAYDVIVCTPLRRYTFPDPLPSP